MIHQHAKRATGESKLSHTSCSRRCRPTHYSKSGGICYTFTVLVGDDTDLLILLCYHACLDSHHIFFRPEPKKTIKHHRVWNIKAIKEQLGTDVSNRILFLHAVLGCDTTSRLYGIGKTSNHFRRQAKVFD